MSPACDNCYASALDKRTGGQHWGSGVERRRTGQKNWNEPKRWNGKADAFMAEHGRRQRVFCASMADVFDNEVPPNWRNDLFRLILETPNLDWLLLTKRIGNAAKMLQDTAEHFGQMMDANDRYRPLPNVWVGSTICNREEMLRDGPKLMAVPARIRFWSVEPLLGEIGQVPAELMPDWVIVGGESGPNARAMLPHWAGNLRDQCQFSGIPFLFKQWGEWAPEGSNSMRIVGKKVAGRLLDGREWNGYPCPVEFHTEGAIDENTNSTY